MFDIKLSKDELKELIEIKRIATAERFKFLQVKSNLKLIPNGRAYVSQTEALANLFDGVFQNTLSKRLTEHGIPEGVEVKVNLETGVIKQVKK